MVKLLAFIKAISGNGIPAKILNFNFIILDFYLSILIGCSKNKFSGDHPIPFVLNVRDKYYQSMNFRIRVFHTSKRPSKNT